MIYKLEMIPEKVSYIHYEEVNMGDKSPKDKHKQQKAKDDVKTKQAQAVQKAKDEKAAVGARKN